VIAKVEEGFIFFSRSESLVSIFIEAFLTRL